MGANSSELLPGPGPNATASNTRNVTTGNGKWQGMAVPEQFAVQLRRCQVFAPEHRASGAFPRALRASDSPRNAGPVKKFRGRLGDFRETECNCELRRGDVPSGHFSQSHNGSHFILDTNPGIRIWIQTQNVGSIEKVKGFPHRNGAGCRPDRQ